MRDAQDAALRQLPSPGSRVERIEEIRFHARIYYPAPQHAVTKETFRTIRYAGRNLKEEYPEKLLHDFPR